MGSDELFLVEPRIHAVRDEAVVDGMLKAEF
jgi:hypothetical protein